MSSLETKLTPVETASELSLGSSSSKSEKSRSEKSESESSNDSDSSFSDNSSDDASTTCQCPSCETVRMEKKELKKMHFDHASTISEFYPGKVNSRVFDRATFDSRRSSNVYDNVDSLVRYPPPQLPPPAESYYMVAQNGTSHFFRHCFPIWSLSTPEGSPSSMTRNLVDSRFDGGSIASTDKKQNICCGRSSESFIAAIGIFGIIIGSAGLIAYLILQVPEFRATIGPNYATVEGRTEYSIYNPSTLIYAVELTAIILTTIVGILVNALLVHGVRRGSCYFLLPWLVYHVLFIAGLLVAIILIVCFALPFIYRLFALIPGFAAVLFIFAWAKVYNLFLRFHNGLRSGLDSGAVQDETSWYAGAEQPSPTPNPH